MLKAIEDPARQKIWPFIKYSNASTKEEFCKIPRKKFLNEAPDPELTSRMQKSCMKKNHPNIHICKKKPETDFARKVHREVKGLLKRLKEKETRRKKRKEGENSELRFPVKLHRFPKKNYNKKRGKNSIKLKKSMKRNGRHGPYVDLRIRNEPNSRGKLPKKQGKNSKRLKKSMKKIGRHGPYFNSRTFRRKKLANI